ncbi:hypothetical protein HID58_049362, partial [Brassica napus]
LRERWKALGSRLKNLRTLNLAYNDFNSSIISTQYTTFKELRVFNLSQSSFSGQVPTELVQLTKLVSLDLSSNTLSADKSFLNKLVRNLTNLRELNLLAIKNWKALSQNLMETTLLHIWTFLLHPFRWLDSFFAWKPFSFNQYPPLCGALGFVNMSSPPFSNRIRIRNKLQGEIPESIGLLKDLIVLNLSSNGFNGNIPSSLGNLTQLESLDLSHNELSGNRGLCLCGPPLNENCGDKEEPSQTEEKEEEDVISWIAAAIGLAPGFIFGMTIGHVVIISKPQWFMVRKKTRRIALGRMSFLLRSICFLFVLNILNTFASPTRHLCRPDEKNALLKFVSEFEIRNLDDDVFSSFSYPKTNSWSNKSDCCSWDGITCHAKSGEVVELDLSSSCFHGKLSSKSSLFKLQRLRVLNLAYNDLGSSEIPSQLGTLKELTLLNLSNTLSSGPIPTELLHLTKLVSLDLSSNSLSAQKSFLNNLSQNLTNLEELNLGLVDISSEIPPNISKLSSLKSLSLDECNLNNSLVFLDLSWISLGNLPVSINNLKHLTTLKLGFCNLHGQISSSLGNLTNLSTLDLSSNFFNGHIPSSFGNLLHLTSLVLSSNRLSGQIPPSFANLNQLTTLSLVSNKLSGNFPLPLLNLTKLSELSLVNNHFTGTLPPNISALCNLETFEASENIFTGTLPSTLFNTPSLTYIDLKDNQLNAILEFGNISSPSKLERLSLGNNHFKGSLPISISSLVNLYSLDLSYYNTGMSVDFGFFLSQLKGLIDLDISYINTTNIVDLSTILLHLKSLSSLQLSGVHVSTAKMGCGITEFPKFLKNLQKMSHLDLSDNKIKDLSSNAFQGPLFDPPVSTEALVVSNNNFTGKIPESICEQRYLQTLDLSNNSFTGSIPQCLKNLNSYLSFLNLHHNQLNGSIPEIFTNATDLVSIDVSQNRLAGKLPRSLKSCTSLEVLNVRSNGIDDTFPFWLNTLPELKVIVLRNNNFKGPLHRHHPFGFPKLQIIDVSNNGFNGTLPSDYFSDWNMTRREDRSGVIYIRYNDYYHDSMVLMSKEVEMKLERILKLLTAIDLSGNELSGKIPDSIGLLKDLIVLNLSSNGFTGDIPSSFGNQSQLESLDLSNNKLSGSIPPSLGDLSSLSYIKVSNNQLHGPIPQSTQFQTQSASSFEGNLGLCGLPLSEKCGEQSQEPEAEEAEEEEGVLSWTAAAIALAPGVILGLTIGHILVTQKTHWFMRFLA